MTNQQHPITPPPELVRQWRKIAPADAAANNAYERHIATQAARWGADQELEACVKWVSEYCLYFGDYPLPEDKLRAARRPRLSSLKEQALAALATADGADHPVVCTVITADQHAIIRRALEQLDD